MEAHEHNMSNKMKLSQLAQSVKRQRDDFLYWDSSEMKFQIISRSYIILRMYVRRRQPMVCVHFAVPPYFLIRGSG